MERPVRHERYPPQIDGQPQSRKEAEALPSRDGGRYRSSASSRWIAFVVVAAIHVALFCALSLIGVAVPERQPAPPLLVSLVPLPTPPSPAPPEKRELPVRRTKPTPVRMVAPQPIVPLPTTPSMAATSTSPPLAPALAVDSPPAPMPREPIAAGNLATRLIAAPAPRYPVESRRKREAGTVTLLVVVGEDGRVETISISRSSGFEQLDRAALSAVRRWRWSPVMIDGQAVKVRGLVQIPFELRL